MNDQKILSWFEAIILAILAAVLYLFFNIDKLFDYLSGADEASKTYFFDQVNDFSDTILNFLGEHILTPSVGTFLLWGAVGTLSYLVVAYFSKQLQTLFEALRNDKSYVHPKNYSRSKFWILLALSAFVTGIVFISLVWWFAFSLNTLGDFAATSVSRGLFQGRTVISAAGQLLLGYGAVLLALIGFRLIIGLSRFAHRLLY